MDQVVGVALRVGLEVGFSSYHSRMGMTEARLDMHWEPVLLSPQWERSLAVDPGPAG